MTAVCHSHRLHKERMFTCCQLKNPLVRYLPDSHEIFQAVKSFYSPLHLLFPKHWLSTNISDNFFPAQVCVPRNSLLIIICFWTLKPYQVIHAIEFQYSSGFFFVSNLVTKRLQNEIMLDFHSALRI